MYYIYKMRDKIIIPINDVEVYIHNPIQKSIYNQRVEILYYDNKIMKLHCILNDKTIFLDPGEIIIWKDLLEQAKFTKYKFSNFNESIYQNEKDCMKYVEEPKYDKCYNRNFNIRRENYISDNHEESIDDYDDFLKEKDDLNSSKKYYNEHDLNFNNKRKYDFIDDNLENLNKKKKEL